MSATLFSNSKPRLAFFVEQIIEKGVDNGRAKKSVSPRAECSKSESEGMYSFFKAKMPPKADGCEDSTTWHKNGDESKDCAWVAEWSPRCSVKGADKSLAAEHCTCACQ